MTSGGFEPDKDPQSAPGGYPPPQQGSYPPPQQGSYPPPQGSYPPPGNYSPPQQGSYPPPPGNYPPPPQFDPNETFGGLPGGGRPGDLGIRFGARLIDGILVAIVAAVLSLIFGGADGYILPGIFSGVLGFAYFVGLEVTQGWTLGKKVLGLSVRGPGGAPKPTLQQSAIRNAFLLLNIIPFVGGLLSFIAWIVVAVTINGSPTKQGKHDEFAGGTQVVKA